MAGSSPTLTPLIGAGLVAATAVIAISSFFAFVGLPYSYYSVTEVCSVGGPCGQMSQSGSLLVPIGQTFVPLTLGTLIAYAMFKQMKGVAWTGIVCLLAFSFLSLPSIGIIYLPFAIILVGINAYSRKVAG